MRNIKGEAEMLELNITLVKATLFLYVFVFIIYFIMKKYIIKYDFSFKKYIVAFIILLIMNIIGACLSVTPDIIVKSGIEINNYLSLGIQGLVYFSLLLVAFIRAALILILRKGLSTKKYGKILWYILLLILLLHDLFGIIDMTMYILGCAVIILVVNKKNS